MTIQAKLSALGLSLPDVKKPAANYVPFARSERIVSISGQISQTPTGIIAGRLGDGLSEEDGSRAAQACALNLLAQIAAVGDGRLSSVARVLRLGVFVAADPDFRNHSQIANGASDLMVAVFGDAGRHSRAAVGVSSLPAGAAVEVEALVEMSAP